MFRVSLRWIVIAGFPLLACEGGTTGPGAEPAELIIEGPKTLQVHETALLSARIIGPSGQESTISWTSSDPSVVRVDSGIVTGLRRGTAKLTARANSLQATLTVSVQARIRIRVMPSTEFPDRFVLTQGDSIRLQAVLVDVNGVSIEEQFEGRWLAWDLDLARVSETGVVVARLPGITRVSAISKDGGTGQIGIEVLWDGLETATVHLVHLSDALGEVSFTLSPGSSHSLHFGESVVLSVPPGGIVVEAVDSAAATLASVTLQLRPRDDMVVYLVGNGRQGMLVPAWLGDASVPPGTGVVRLVQGSSSPWWAVVYVVPPGAPAQFPPLECYFDPGNETSFSRPAGVFDLVLQTKPGSSNQLRTPIVVPSGASVTYVLKDDGVAALPNR